ncbi:MAG: hypothetical protein MZV64_13820 [Ignavibacteriales bacterium]|nr:hypothetical protein [Ignavibacteriales bacterium]
MHRHHREQAGRRQAHARPQRSPPGARAAIVAVPSRGRDEAAPQVEVRGADLLDGLPGVPHRPDEEVHDRGAELHVDVARSGTRRSGD